MKQHVVVGIGGVARAGKDTLGTLLRNFAFDRGFGIISFAFADALKRDLDPILTAKYGISAWTTDPKEKAIIRPDLVAHGKNKRAESNGRYWIEQLNGEVRTYLDPRDVEPSPTFLTVTDVRYATHADDEAGWVKALGGRVVYLERIGPDGKPIGPANEEEAINDPLVRAAADHFISWPTFVTNDLPKTTRPYIETIWEKLTSPLSPAQ